jgi:hypothetical protein
MGKQIEKQPVRIIVLENSPFPVFTQGLTAHQIEAIQKRSLEQYGQPQNSASKDAEKLETIKRTLDH